ncbi:MAG: peptide chain release factor N(5)-glutamine methyltransferase [Bacilli bacterium]|nr:peptide chain release factor N(5)-glutamine methyltransferase [Bacilli bacterium]
MTVRELLEYGNRKAHAFNKEESAIKLLLMHFLQKESYELIMMMNEEVDKEKEDAFKQGVELYVEKGIPVQHIMGYVYFYGYKFMVGKDVLIPRFETEELVANVLMAYDDFFNGQEVDVVDIGTGSGAIAISLALEEPNMRVDATDISADALEVARQNAANLGVNVNFYLGDLLEPLIKLGKKYDILVSNPPYIPEDEYVEDLVKNNEPHLALFGGKDGTAYYELILKDAKHVLKKRSIIAFEHGWNQKMKLSELINKYFPDSQYETINDINGKDRITIIYNK